MCEQDLSELYVVPDLDGMEAISAVFRRQHFRPHFHDTFLIGVVVGGAERFDARGESHLAMPGTVRLFNPGEVHTGMPPEGAYWAYRCAYPSSELVQTIAGEIAGKSPGEVHFGEVVVSDHALASRLATALASLDRPASTLERSSLLREALAAIISAHGYVAPRPLGRETKAVATARDYIVAHASADFSLRDLSRAACLSPFHLLRVFKAQTGLTPFEFQNQVRVENARRDLATGFSVGDVADRNGFCDRSHLARVFRATVGVNPLAFRRAHRNAFAGAAS